MSQQENPLSRVLKQVYCAMCGQQYEVEVNTEEPNAPTNPLVQEGLLISGCPMCTAGRNHLLDREFGKSE